MQRIDTPADIEAALAALIAADPRLEEIAAIAGPLPLRRRPGGFEGLASIVTAQQISSAAAASIWGRFVAAVDPFTAEQFLVASEETLRKVGLSRAKISTLSGIATACGNGLDLEALHDLPADEAVAAMTALKGIGPWTAEIYLLFCIGHADIFPAGDLALRVGVQLGLGLAEKPSEKAVRDIAAAWSPWRGVAARLFWTYYRKRRGIKAEVVPLRGGG
jgi:DNA-3-methyladenine glycosylase II